VSTADSKPVKTHEFTAASFLGPHEHILCAVVIGPDRDDPILGHTLHLRASAHAIELIRALPISTRTMIVEHQERLLSEFRKLMNL
jgi:hypothetical protein